MAISGPWGMNEYLGHGQFKVGGKAVQASRVGMMAGGTGITPMLQARRALSLIHPSLPPAFSCHLIESMGDASLSADLAQISLLYTTPHPSSPFSPSHPARR
jgi:NAD(P)H-flavin reductase